MNVAHGRADLGVAVAVDILFEEVDQAPVALQDRQHTQVRTGGARENSGSIRAPKSESIKTRQNARKASQMRFKLLSSCPLSVVHLVFQCNDRGLGCKRRLPSRPKRG